jgi:hypothetical protein
MTRFAGLAKLMRDLDRVPSQIAADASEAIEDLITDQFSTGTDPYGTPWADLKKGGRSYLYASGDMQASVDVHPKPGAGIEIQIDAEPFIFHQRGTRKMVARPIIPNRGIPEKWTQAIAEAYEKRMKNR